MCPMGMMKGNFPLVCLIAAATLRVTFSQDFGCVGTNLTDAHRQKLLDYHNGFRSNVAKGVTIVDREGHTFTFPTAKDMFKV
ncbi:hypothetical protein AAVH_42830, partial [Aphelenchoides avenae]